MHIAPTQPPAAPAPTRVAHPVAAAPRVHAAARGGDPLPSFPDARAYQNYVINLVAQARQLDQDIEAARKAAGDKPGDPTVAALRERLDAVKLQLKILRDDYPMPSEWTRSTMLLGQGFDKERFWRDQVEAIPGKPVVVTPAPAAPGPAATKPTPASLPALPAPPAVPHVALPSEPADPAVANALRIALMAHQNGMSSTASDGFKKATGLCKTPGDAMAVFLAAHLKGYSTSASNAAAAATKLAADMPTAVAIAEAAHAKGYSTSASNAYAAARGSARTSADALQVALSAHQKGYSSSAGDAFNRATELATTSAEALQAGDVAGKKGYSSAGARAMKRAMDLP